MPHRIIVIRSEHPRSSTASLLLLSLITLAAACTSDPPPRLPDNVTVAIVYNEPAERWHAGAIVQGDRPESILRVLCLTEEGKPGVDGGHSHTGINIDAQPGDLGGRSGSDWSWHLDGQPWDGGRWRLDFNTSPATVVARDPDVEAALLRDLRSAKVAELINSRAGEEVVRVRFDLAPLFSTPVQFAIDNCNEDTIEDRAGEYHSAYAYWLPNFERHSISLIAPDPDDAGRLVLSCGPKAFADDGAPDWIRNTNGDIVAAAMLFTNSDDANDHVDSQSAEIVAVSWTDDDGKNGTSHWERNHSWLRPSSADDNLRFIDAVRRSETLTVTIEASDAGPIWLTLRGPDLFAKPMGAELDTCIREYADLND